MELLTPPSCQFYHAVQLPQRAPLLLLLMSAAETTDSQIKQGRHTCVPHTNQNTLNEHNRFAYADALWSTQHFLSFRYLGTHPPLFALAQPEEKKKKKKWLITMATVCAVLLELWCMWWHFWPSCELYNEGAKQSAHRARLPCLS